MTLHQDPPARAADPVTAWLVRVLDDRPRWLVRLHRVAVVALPAVVTSYSIWYDALAAQAPTAVVELAVFVVAGTGLAFARRAPLVPALLAVVCWAATGSCSFVMVMSYVVAERRPRWWPVAIAVFLLVHPVGLVPDPCSYRAGHVVLPAATAPLLGVALPAAIGGAVGTARRVVGRREADLRRIAETAGIRAAAVVAQERLRLSRDLHDSVGRDVSRMALHATAITVSTDDDRVRALAGKIADAAGRCVADLQLAIGLLRGRAADEVSGEALDEAVAHAEQHGLRVHRDDAALAGVRRADVRVTVEAVLAEALHNAVKYAPGSRVGVRVEVDDGHVRATVENGAPPIAGTAPRSGGFGLAVATERVAAAGGRLVAEPTPDGGFRVDVEVPT